MNNQDNISLPQLAEELGFHRGKNYLIKAAELWCNKPHESASFHPSQQIKEGQVRTANELLEYLKK